MEGGPAARHQKKAEVCGGIVVWEDEASFWLDGTLHQTWSRVGVQPRVATRGERKTAHVFGAVSLDARWVWDFQPVFNGHTFHLFLMLVVNQFAGRKVFMIMDNGPCHWLDDAGKAWLTANSDKIELHRLPPYSPEFNPVEGCWKATRREATHNRYYATTDERDTALRATFTRFQAEPGRVDGHVRRYQGATATA